MAMCGVRNKDVDTSVDQRCCALPCVTKVTNRGTNHESAVSILSRIRILLTLNEILDRDQPGEPA